MMGFTAFSQVRRDGYSFQKKLQWGTEFDAFELNGYF